MGPHVLADLIAVLVRQDHVADHDVGPVALDHWIALGADAAAST